MKKAHFLILSSILISCSEQDLNDYISDNVLYNLSFSSESVTVSPIEENHTIYINTNTEWSAQTSDEWIVLENYHGSSNGELRFETKANPLASIREGKIGIYCFGKHKKDILVKQSNVSLTLNQEVIECSSNSHSQEISFETIGSWKITSPEEWIKIVPNKGFGNSIVKITIDESMSAKERIGSIKIIDQSSQFKEVQVFQKGKYLHIDKNYLSFLASGETQESINIKTDGELEYTVDNWINISILNDTIIKVNVSKNSTGQVRKLDIPLKLKNVPDLTPKEISIYQAPILVNVEAVDLGLSVKWASFNIGALSDDDIGGHYLYGEGPEFTYKWYESSKYNFPNNVTGTHFDTAQTYWGGKWRIPTKKEWTELYDNCLKEIVDFQGKEIELYNEKTNITTYINVGSKAIKFTAINGNYIIIPIAGMWQYWEEYYENHSNDRYVTGSFNYKTSSKEYPQMTIGIYNFDEALVWPHTSWDKTFNAIRAVWED